MNKILLSTVFLLFVYSGFGQVTYKIHNTAFQKLGTVRVTDVKEDWHPSLQNIEAVQADKEGESAELQQLKEELSKQYPAGRGQYPEKRMTAATIPYMHNNFQGNAIGSSVPNDNTLAVGNDGKVLSAINNTFNIYSTSPNSQLSSISLDAFSASLGITGSKYDPKLLYDPGSDKYILVFLNSTAAATSRIIICFSQTNNPQGNWNFYSLAGNPENDTTWTDFPQIAVSDKELFITVNAVIPNQPWQTGFRQTYIWQVDKQGGYAGNLSITSRLWDYIKYSGTIVRYFTPVQGGSKVYGSNMYFLSSNNFGNHSDTLFLAEITGLQSDISTTLNIQLLATDKQYSAPPDALQAYGSFATNDARVSGAFFENNQIQYVHSTLDTITGFPAVYHGVVDNVTGSPTVHGEIIGDNLLGFGYPNLSYIGTSLTDHSSIISFDHSAKTVYAGMSSLAYDGTGYSSIITVKAGSDYINAIASKQERWGDYFGSQPRYNQPGTIWIAGTFGVSQNYGTWIAELNLTSTVGINEPASVVSNPIVFPNPVQNLMTVKFTATKEDYLYFEVYSVDGRLIHRIYQVPVTSGENEFRFSTAPLAQGEYLLKIRSNSENLLTEKIVKQ